MQSVGDEVRISLLASNDLHKQPGLPHHLEAASSTTSLSSATIFDSEDPATYDTASCHRRHSSNGSTDTLVGALVAKRFPGLWHRLPFVRSAHAYKPVATDAEPRKLNLNGRRLRVVGVLLLAAFLLGVGGSKLHKSMAGKATTPEDPFLASLHDDDSWQDKAVITPTFPRPLHPTEPEEILPFGLHHDDADPPPLRAPASSAPNRRQLDVIPAQRILFDNAECLDEWVAEGKVCDEFQGAYGKRPDLTNVDLLYSWVNGSDWRHSSASWMHAYRPTGRWQEYAEEDLFPSFHQLGRRDAGLQGQTPTKRTAPSKALVPSRFRDHEELRYSMRSAAKHLHGLRTIHIVSPDFSAPYHLQPGAKLPRQKRSSQPPFMLTVDRLEQGFVGLPSQLRRVQDIGTDRFMTHENQLREGQVPQWLAITEAASVLAGQDAESDSPAQSSLPQSIAKLFALASDDGEQAISPNVRLHHDWNAVTDNWLVSRPVTEREHQQRDNYRRSALPTFNSMAIESMLGDQPGLADSFVYANDDFFLLDDVSVADVTSPLFGPVMRLDYNLVVKGVQSPDATPGEWSSLWHTNWLLDQRFGARKRPYVQHVHKSFSKALLHETRMGWAAEHARLGINRFRNAGDNIVTHFLAYFNVVERHREAMLWSFFMLRLDSDGDGVVSDDERREALLAMGLTQEQASRVEGSQSEADCIVEVKLARRSTLAKDHANEALVKAAWPVPLKSQYSFVSQDGYPLGDVSDRVIYRRSQPRMQRRTSPRDPYWQSSHRGESGYFGWPDFVDDPTAHPNNEWHNRRFDRPACQLDPGRCFVRPFSGAKVQWQDVFTRFAYEDVACGDCLIHHLVGQSGTRGLSAFLPEKHRTYEGKTEPEARRRKAVPHLPLSSVWNASAPVDAAAEAERACFSVACVLANSGFGHGTRLRDFASRLIQRYAYTIAETPIEFHRMETLYSATKVMQALQSAAARPSALDRFAQANGTDTPAPAWVASQRNIDIQRPALVCINDDITDKWADQVAAKFTAWMHNMWPEKPAWEL